VLAVSFDELRNTYETASASGGGPDLFIAPTDWVGGMAEAGLIAPIDDLADEDFLGRFIPTTVDALRYQGELYGIPESFEAVAMFYRTDLVDAPPTTLEDWLAMAAEGNQIAINSGFYHSFWGIQAFGGQLFDENGVVILDQGGTADYLNWMAEAKEAPGVVMDPDGGKLDSLFKEGEVAFVLNGPWASGDYQGAEKIAGNVGVAPIPAGPAGASGPFLGIKEFLFNSASSDDQLLLALEFVKFVTNVENETMLMEQANHLPANKNVDTSGNPIVAGFVAQAETAVPFPNIPEMGAVWGPAGDMITKVIEGAASAEEAIAEAVSLINQANQK
jgi:arabinogalactan oligomer/maltooligosaccharide transport system substrate-binding protein